MNVIIYESISDNVPFRSKEELVKILKETKTDMILRAVERSHYINSEKFNIIKDKISYIKSKLPNIKIIGILYEQSIDRWEKDDITDKEYSGPTGCTSLPNTSLCCNGESYKMAFDPSKYGITDSTGKLITKCDYQLSFKQYHGTGASGRWRPDITNIDFQTLFVHQAEKLIKAGCDGVWIDMLTWQASYLLGNKKYLEVVDSVDAVITICNKIKKLKTLSGSTPMISTWSLSPVKYFLDNPNFTKELFDFYTAVIGSDEIKSLYPNDKYNRYIKQIKQYFDNTPLIPYIDWGNGLHPTWWFTQSITDKEQRKKFQIEILKIFTEYFKLLNSYYNSRIDFAYPVHGMPMCNPNYPKSGYKSPCNVLSYGKYTRYDSKAPEFDTYDTIKELMNPYKFPIVPNVCNPSQIQKFILGGLVIGTYLVYRNYKKSL